MVAQGFKTYSWENMIEVIKIHHANFAKNSEKLISLTPPL
jgi:hypothetical protein